MRLIRDDQQVTEAKNWEWVLLRIPLMNLTFLVLGIVAIRTIE
jgi:hypothetical protein